MEVENSLADLVTQNLLESHVGSTPSLGTLKENVTIHAEMNPNIFSAAHPFFLLYHYLVW